MGLGTWSNSSAKVDAQPAAAPGQWNITPRDTNGGRDRVITPSLNSNSQAIRKLSIRTRKPSIYA